MNVFPYIAQTCLRKSFKDDFKDRLTKPAIEAFDNYENKRERRFLRASCFLGMILGAGGLLLQTAEYLYAWSSGDYFPLTLPILTNLFSVRYELRRMQTLKPISEEDINMTRKELYPRTWRLRQDLRRELGKENYEYAAELRDKINLTNEPWN